jgi:hypothetical protein
MVFEAINEKRRLLACLITMKNKNFEASSSYIGEVLWEIIRNIHNSLRL